jgi:hypothetical protein
MPVEGGVIGREFRKRDEDKFARHLGYSPARPKRHDALAGIELAPGSCRLLRAWKTGRLAALLELTAGGRPRLKASGRLGRPVSLRMRRGVADWLRSWGRRIGW